MYRNFFLCFLLVFVSRLEFIQTEETLNKCLDVVACRPEFVSLCKERDLEDVYRLKIFSSLFPNHEIENYRESCRIMPNETSDDISTILRLNFPKGSDYCELILSYSSVQNETVKESCCINKLSFEQMLDGFMGYTVGFCDTCDVPNFQVSSFVSEDHHKQIHLKVTWSDSTGTADILIVPRDDQACYMGFEPWRKIDLNETASLQLPELNNSVGIEVSNNCVYIITMVHNGTCEKIYRVPECVGEGTWKICRCDFHSNAVNITSFHLDDEDKVEITWESENTTEYIEGIENVALNPVNTDITAQCDPATYSFDIVNRTLQFSCLKLPRDEEYNLTVSFKNNVRCLTTVWHVYPLDDYIAEENNITQYFIASIVIVVVLLLFVGFNFIVSNQKCLSKFRGIVPERFRWMLPLSQTSETPHCSHFPEQTVMIPGMHKNYGYTPLEFLEGLFDEFEVPRNKLQIRETIGHGAFGQVFSAKAFRIGGSSAPYEMVAVKTLGENSSMESTDDFIAEIEIYKNIGHHPNIVKLLGCCLKQGPPYYLIMELVPCGDLKNYLLSLRKQWQGKTGTNYQKTVFFPDDSDGAYIQSPESPGAYSQTASSRLPSTSTISTNIETPAVTPRTPRTPPLPVIDSFENERFGSPPSSPRSPTTPLIKHFNDSLVKLLDTKELQDFALQIARGMEHLEKIPITHRDLAARNILINEYKQLKISDFGLSRRGPYRNYKVKKLPIRWMALESITEQKYDSKSDVWAFGVVLWEIGTLAGFPYEDVPDHVLVQFLKMGDRLPRPEICTDELYRIMMNCWLQEPNDRPTFAELTELLDVTKRKVYVDFTQLNPAYMFPRSQENDNEAAEKSPTLEVVVEDN